jgi:hypothetical protein
MRRAMSLTLLVIAAGIAVVSAQVKEPADSSVHRVIGVVAEVSTSSITLRAGNGVRELKIDKSTRIASYRTFRNDLVLRTPRPGISESVKVGDDARVSYRDDNGELTAVAIDISAPKQPRK